MLFFLGIRKIVTRTLKYREQRLLLDEDDPRKSDPDPTGLGREANA